MLNTITEQTRIDSSMQKKEQDNLAIRDDVMENEFSATIKKDEDDDIVL